MQSTFVTKGEKKTTYINFGKPYPNTTFTAVIFEGDLANFKYTPSEYLKDKNIWALFLRPEFEKQGIGRQLHDRMLNWYFDQTSKNVWLGTSPNTRAELFYRKAGWKEIGTHGDGEIKFEMTFEAWTKMKC